MHAALFNLNMFFLVPGHWFIQRDLKLCVLSELYSFWLRIASNSLCLTSSPHHPCLTCTVRGFPFLFESFCLPLWSISSPPNQDTELSATSSPLTSDPWVEAACSGTFHWDPLQTGLGLGPDDTGNTGRALLRAAVQPGFFPHVETAHPPPHGTAAGTDGLLWRPLGTRNFLFGITFYRNEEKIEQNI